MCFLPAGFGGLHLVVLALETTCMSLAYHDFFCQCSFPIFVPNPGTVEFSRSFHNSSNLGKLWRKSTPVLFLVVPFRV